MEIRIAIAVVAAALTLSTQVAAQQAFQPAAWPGTTSPSAGAHFFTGYPVSSSARTAAYVPRLAGNSLEGGLPERSVPVNRDFLQIAGSFNTQSHSATLTKQLLYVSSPFWLRHSRPFPNDSHASTQPGEGVLNQVAASFWPTSKE